jgi:hypothetical protein
VKDRLINWLFERLFGKLDMKAHVYVTKTHFVIAELSVTTRFGVFDFPFFNKELPAPGESLELRVV